jgi:excinuclease UvrABC ATPase subunit
MNYQNQRRDCRPRAPIDGLPPAVALQQQRGSPTTRSSVGSVTTLSNLLRMPYSRAGDYPRHQAHLDAEAFLPNTPAGACPRRHGLGRVYEVTERSMVPDDSKSIRERAIAAWPPAWHGGNLRDMLITLGYDSDCTPEVTRENARITPRRLGSPARTLMRGWAWARPAVDFSTSGRG